MYSNSKPKRLQDNYRIGKVLGSGTFGIVRQATHKKTSQEYAVKIFPKSALYKEMLSESLKNEIEILKNLDHPNIIKIFDDFEDQKHFYFIMEKCQGGDLNSLIPKKNFFTEVFIVKILKQLLSALSYLHDNNIVHRDIKLENILFLKDKDYEKIKIIDFGVAQYYQDNKFMTVSVGTLLYTAPEVLEQRYNEKCDLWSCGVVAYVLICGVLPFLGKNDYEIVGKIKRCQVNWDEEIWGRYGWEAKDFVMRLLCEDSRRMTARQALEHEFLNSF
ncbi:hypothetical protein SteCoe_14122 [Stentor coeruleus]|uniref:non-specific serine/threonine protein kinase n=1 Tax=Stentor coeruleus TaxID=5963 RepID=A0A1R2C6X4_9CILI|nr:hypothetical protein SteCoe_14122 [Stentor coeruleus]